MKRKLKLTTAALLAAATLFTLVGCSSAKSLTFAASYFLPEKGTSTVANVNEECTYSVSFTQREAQTDVMFSVSESESKYVTKLTKETYGEGGESVDCYKYVTELTLNGQFDVKGSGSVDVETHIKTEVYFLGLKDSFKPLYSSRSVKAASPVSDADGFKVKLYEYTVQTSYNGTSAKSTFTPVNASDGDYSLAAGETEYSDALKKTYFDNEFAFFLPRALDLAANDSFSYDSIDALSGVVRGMKLSVPSSFKSTLKLNDYLSGYEKKTELAADAVEFSLQDGYSGGKTTAYYASLDDLSERRRLLKLESEAYYGMGTLTFNIKTSKYGA